jgi:hypothetical protein
MAEPVTTPAEDVPVPPAPAPSAWDKAKAAALAWLAANWKKYLLWALAALAAVAYNRWKPDGAPDVPVPPPPPFEWPDHPFGWEPPTEEEFQRTLTWSPLFKNTEAGSQTEWGDDQPIKAYLLYVKATGQSFGPYQQGPVGCCVSFGSAGAVQMSLGANIALGRGPPQKADEVSREVIYGGGRVNIRRPMLPPEGMMGSWAAEWLNQSGAVGVSQGSPPVGPYDPNRAKQWGSRGVPAAVAALGKDNPVKVALVTSAEDVKNALANGYFTFICSSVGFGNIDGPPLQRDSQGFLRQDPRYPWPHCMFVAGYRGDRKGFLIVNSWGAGWVVGPKGFGDEPEGSFWADYATVDRIVKGSSREPPDSFSISLVGGFKKALIEPRDWLIRRVGDDTPPAFLADTRPAFGWVGAREFHRR